MTREQRLARAFVELADTLVAQFDVIDFLHTLTERCVELLSVDAAGLMLADQRGQLRVIASSAESARLVEIFELQHSEGPCMDCFHSGQPIVNVGEDVPSSEYRDLLKRLDGVGSVLSDLGVGESPAGIASGIEFVLEGLHLTKRLNKDAVGARASYRARG